MKLFGGPSARTRKKSKTLARNWLHFPRLSAEALGASEVQNLLAYSRKFQKQRWKKFYINPDFPDPTGAFETELIV